MAALLSTALAAGCGGGASSPASPAIPPGMVPVFDVPPEFADARLSAGRTVWLGTCRGCHEIGVADAPRLGDAPAWAPRIAKGSDTLYTHALEGFFGPAGTMMPPRGGNAALTDDEVRAAVDYMVAASRTR